MARAVPMLPCGDRAGRDRRLLRRPRVRGGRAPGPALHVRRVPARRHRPARLRHAGLGPGGSRTRPACSSSTTPRRLLEAVRGGSAREVREDPGQRAAADHPAAAPGQRRRGQRVLGGGPQRELDPRLPGDTLTRAGSHTDQPAGPRRRQRRGAGRLERRRRPGAQGAHGRRASRRRLHSPDRPARRPRAPRRGAGPPRRPRRRTRHPRPARRAPVEDGPEVAAVRAQARELARDLS